MSSWFRIHYRNKAQAIVHGAEELQKIRSTRRNDIRFYEEADEYACATCGVCSAWPAPSAFRDVDLDWRWFGAIADLKQGHEPDIYCSKACEPAFDDRNGITRPGYIASEEWPCIHFQEPVII